MAPWVQLIHGTGVYIHPWGFATLGIEPQLRSIVQFLRESVWHMFDFIIMCVSCRVKVVSSRGCGQHCVSRTSLMLCNQPPGPEEKQCLITMHECTDLMVRDYDLMSCINNMGRCNLHPSWWFTFTCGHGDWWLQSHVIQLSGTFWAELREVKMRKHMEMAACTGNLASCFVPPSFKVQFPNKRWNNEHAWAFVSSNHPFLRAARWKYSSHGFDSICMEAVAQKSD